MVVLPEPQVHVPGKPPETEIYSSIPPTHHVYGFKEKIPPELARLASEAGTVADTPQAMEGDEGIIADGDVVTVGGRLAYEMSAEASADSRSVRTESLPYQSSGLRKTRRRDCRDMIHDRTGPRQHERIAGNRAAAEHFDVLAQARDAWGRAVVYPNKR